MISRSDANQLKGCWGGLLIAFSNLFISCPAALHSGLEGRKRAELVCATTHASSGCSLIIFDLCMLYIYKLVLVYVFIYRPQVSVLLVQVPRTDKWGGSRRSSHSHLHWGQSDMTAGDPQLWALKGAAEKNKIYLFYLLTYCSGPCSGYHYTTQGHVYVVSVHCLTWKLGTLIIPIFYLDIRFLGLPSFQVSKSGSLKMSVQQYQRKGSSLLNLARLTKHCIKYYKTC